MLYKENIRHYVKETGMLAGHDCVVCGVSGGADSVYLFAVLRELSAELDLKLRVVHVHHGIRGAEADRDAAYVEELCRREGVPFSLYRRNIPAEAAAGGMSLEEAGREARREIYALEGEHFKEYEKTNARRVRIALAHHRDDLAESVLFRLARGSGVHGLAAIRPVSPLTKERPDLCIIRPLLMTSRAQIEEALREAGMDWCEDSTNAGDDAARNRIRHNILPALVREVNSGAAAHIAASALMAAEVSDFLKAEAEKRYVEYVTPGDACIKVSGGLISKELPAMRSEVLRMAVQEAARTSRDIGRIHIEDLTGLFGRDEGKEIHLPGGVLAVKDAGGISLQRDPAGLAASRGQDTAKAAGRTHKVRKDSPPGDSGNGMPPEGLPVVPGETIKCKNISISAHFEPSVPARPPEKRYTKTINYDNIKDTLVLRTRKTGDYITVRGDGARKSLGNYFTDEKVPRELRDSIPLIADGSEIVWVVGMRIGYRYRIDEFTKRALTISAVTEEEKEGI